MVLEQASGQRLQAGEKEENPDGEEEQGHGEAVSICTYPTKGHGVLAGPGEFFFTRSEIGRPPG